MLKQVQHDRYTILFLFFMVPIPTVIAGKLFLNNGWRRGILALSIFPIAIMKDGLRIVTLSLLTVYVDKRILSSPLHKDGGILFFILGVIILWPILWLLRRSEKV
jgi:exosortase/archaeosortase family protein